MIILITGGASGLGEAITKRLARDPQNKIFFTYNNSESNAKAIEKEYPNTSSFQCDFTKENEVQNLINNIEKVGIEVLINNAYIGEFIDTHFYKTPISHFSDTFTTNILTTLSITQAAIKYFRLKKAGKIVTVLSSTLLSVPPIGTAIYTANKAYMQQMAKIWAIENAKYNITSYSIWPELMRTNFTSKLDDRLIDQIQENATNKKLLTVDEVAEVIYLALQTSEKEKLQEIETKFGIQIK